MYNRGKELLAAAKIEFIVNAPGHYSFTTALMQILLYPDHDEQYLMVAQVQRKMIDQQHDNKARPHARPG